MVYGFVAKHCKAYPVTFMCRMLGVSRAGYYRWRERQVVPPTLQAQRRQEIAAAVSTIFAETRGRVGRRPMRQLLAQRGIRCSPGLVHRVMADQGFEAQRRRAWKRTTVRDPAARTAHITNHCQTADGQRQFTSDRPGSLTVGDITYLRTQDGWLYLAVVIDLATRAVVGWALRPHLRTDLVTTALDMAFQHRRIGPGAIFHSDRGSQYTAQAFQAQCVALGITQSMGANGVCWDNAVAESFFATLKADLLVEEGTFASHRAARQWVIRYIEGWYNRRRPHSWNDGRAPLDAWVHAISPLSPVSVS